MLRLRSDPWDPGYGMGFDAPETDEPPATVDQTVESDDWSRPLSPPPPADGEGPVVFLDGVRRIDLRLRVEDGGRRAAGLFGSYAVGAVRVDGLASFGEHVVGRALIAGGGIAPEAVEVAVGAHRMRFAPESVPGGAPDEPLRRLQQILRRTEGDLARRVAADEGSLVLADGRLSFFDPTVAPVVGVIKRFSRHYLDADAGALLGMLAPGHRTPLFTLLDEKGGTHRYAWYLRLVPLRGAWHDHAGIVRCEATASIGLGEAAALADRVSALLPRFAGRPSDPRAPQNLAPVGALETRLRHLMGDERLVRRALDAHLQDRVA